MLTDFIGIPYASRGRSLDGADCYGLVRLVLAHVQGAAIPDVLEYIDADHAQSVERAVLKNIGQWQKVPFEDRQPYDVLMMNLAGRPVHTGIVINDTKMLHTLRGCASVIERYNSPSWSRRIEGVYRWAK